MHLVIKNILKFLKNPNNTTLQEQSYNWALKSCTIENNEIAINLNLFVSKNNTVSFDKKLNLRWSLIQNSEDNQNMTTEINNIISEYRTSDTSNQFATYNELDDKITARIKNVFIDSLNLPDMKAFLKSCPETLSALVWFDGIDSATGLSLTSKRLLTDSEQITSPIITVMNITFYVGENDIDNWSSKFNNNETPNVPIDLSSITKKWDSSKITLGPTQNYIQKLNEQIYSNLNQIWKFNIARDKTFQELLETQDSMQLVLYSDTDDSTKQDITIYHNGEIDYWNELVNVVGSFDKNHIIKTKLIYAPENNPNYKLGSKIEFEFNIDYWN